MPESPTPAAPRPRKRFLARVFFGLATLVLLIVMLNPAEIARDLAKADLRYVMAGFGTCLAALAVRTLKWCLILKRLGLQVPYLRLLEVYTISYWFSTFLPGSLGGDLYKIYDVARATEKKVRPAVTVILERLTGVLALLGLTIAALIGYGRDLPIPAWVLPMVLAVAGGTTLALLSVVLFFEPLWTLTNRIAPWTHRLIKEQHRQGLADVSREVRGNHWLFIEAMVLSLAVQALVLLSYFLMARAISSQIALTYFFTLYPLVEIASMVPISINGMGIREGLTVFSMNYFQITPAVSMSIGILFRLVAIALAVLGGVLLAFRRKADWKAVPSAGG